MGTPEGSLYGHPSVKFLRTATAYLIDLEFFNFLRLKTLLGSEGTEGTPSRRLSAFPKIKSEMRELLQGVQATMMREPRSLACSGRGACQ